MKGTNQMMNSIKDVVRIGLVEKDDIPDMMRIWNNYYTLLTSTNIIHTIESLTNWFETKHEINHEMYGLYVNNMLKGFMIIDYEDNGIFIKMTVIDPYYQRKGYGKLLVNHVIDNNKNSGFIKTEVKIENFKVINALIKNGFEITEFYNNLREYVLKFIHTL